MAEPWEGVVKIPEGKAGEYAIEHFTRPAGPVERSNFRTALIGGQADPPLEFNRETRWHRLVYGGGVWMTDLPIEQAQHDRELTPILKEGTTVLVGGLGVGYATNVLAACPTIERVVVVEISPEVVALVGPHVRDPRGVVEIVNADLFDYLRKNRENDDDDFDFGFYDIWQSDGEGTFFNTVCPLRELSHGFVQDVICWNENVMRGQLVMGLQTRLFATVLQPPGKGRLYPPLKTIDDLATEVGDMWHDWSAPFYAFVREHLGSVIDKKDGTLNLDERFMEWVYKYVRLYGHPGWKLIWDLEVAAHFGTGQPLRKRASKGRGKKRRKA